MFKIRLMILLTLSAGCIRYEVRTVNPIPKNTFVVLERDKSIAIEEKASIRRVPDGNIADSLYDFSVESVIEGPGETRKNMQVKLSKRTWSPLHIPVAIVGTAVYTTIVLVMSPFTISRNGFEGFNDLFVGKNPDCASGIWVGATYNSIGILNGDAELFDLCRTEHTTEEVQSEKGEKLRTSVTSIEPKLDLVLEYRADGHAKMHEFPFQTNLEAGTSTQNLIDVFSKLAEENASVSDVVISVKHQSGILHRLPLSRAALDMHLRPYKHALTAQRALAAKRTEQAVNSYLAAYASISDFRSESFFWYKLLESFKKSNRAYSDFTLPKFDLFPRDRFDPGPEVDTSGWIISPSAYQLVRKHPLDIRIWLYIAQTSNCGGAFSDRVQQLSIALAAK